MAALKLLFHLVWLIISLILETHAVPHNTGSKTHGYGSAKNVLIFGIDGLGGVHLENVTSKYPGFRSFFEEGSFTTKARCETPTVSASNWGTLITGMTPAEAGIQANYWTPKYARPENITQRGHFAPISGEGVPENIFDVIYKQKDLEVYMGYTWDWFHHFTTNETVDHMFRGAQLPYFNGTADWLKCAFSFGCIKHSDEAVYNATVKAIKDRQPNVMFLHFCK
ncbi:alkaline phosphatase [Paramuricea clavata]|uniref:Alkaline phosphatase n=1 Tax=Paramuricea clavata TaxID=317549 RepID=A0A7D9I1L3_PARCT|nr:alkaline phosphatase [Paramuricea clavata]